MEAGWASFLLIVRSSRGGSLHWKGTPSPLLWYHWL